MKEEKKDLLLFTDEDGQEIQMEVLDYFMHEDQEYALLTAIDDDVECDECMCECEEKELYIMKVVINGDTEEFTPVDEDKIDELMDAIEEMYGEQEEYDEYDEDNDGDED